MNPCDRTVMLKETILKDDGRRLIYYRFVPEEAAPAETSPAPEATTPASDEER